MQNIFSIKTILRSLLLVIAVMFYLWTVTEGHNKFDFYNSHGTYYNKLAEGFLQGHLYMAIEPNPGLVSLSDPYDPALNGPYKVHDVSFYKGKYYLYFGPTPVILMYLPYWLMMHKGLQDQLVIFAFSVGALLFSFLFLLWVKNTYFSTIKEWKFLTAISVVAFANVVPVLLRRPAIYENAIACGVCLIMASIYFFSISFSKKNAPSIPLLSLGSLCLGLAIGARPQVALFLILLFVVCFKIWIEISNGNNILKYKLIGAALLPFLFCLLLCGLYNYFRFDNFLEFGTTYQLAGKHINKLGLFNFARIPANMHFNLFQLPYIDSKFPFIHMFPQLPPGTPIGPGYDYGGIVGIIPGIPFVIILLTSPLLMEFLGLSKKEYILFLRKLKFPLYEFVLLLLAAFIHLFILLFMSGAIMRYVADYATLLILASAIVWFYYDSCLVPYTLKSTVFNIACMLLAITSVTFGLAFNIASPEAHLANQNPTEFNKIRGLFDNSISYRWEKIASTAHAIPFSLETNNNFSGEYRIENSYDGNLSTDWAPLGSKPVIVSLKPAVPAKIKSLWLLSRDTHLFETWQKLSANLYLNGTIISKQDFKFPNAFKDRIQRAEFTPTLTDKIELELYDPVTVNQKGIGLDPTKLYPVYPADFCPGYTEIAIDWE